MIFRRAQTEDLCQLSILEINTFASDIFSEKLILELLTQDDAYVCIAENEGQIVGAAYMLWEQQAKRGRLFSMGVHPDFQGQKIGSRLISAGEREAISRSIKNIFLEVRQDNLSAIRFYKKHSFREESIIPEFYEDATSAIKMTKSLS